MSTQHRQALIAALQWHIDAGADELLADEALDRFAVIEKPKAAPTGFSDTPQEAPVLNATAAAKAAHVQAPAAPRGAHKAQQDALESAKNAATLEELSEAIKTFEDLPLKKTAGNIVFADGNSAARVMIITDAPGADEDRQGIPFAGESGALLDKILGCIDLSRTHEKPEQSVYLTNFLNCRPPGGRSPAVSEIDISLPFIERHIALANPDILLFMGGTTAKTLLKTTKGTSRLRKQWHDYKPLTEGITDNVKTIPALVTYHPALLLQNPAQKKAVWDDILMLQDRLKDTSA